MKLCFIRFNFAVHKCINLCTAKLYSTLIALINNKKMQLQTSMHFKRQLLFDNNNSNHKHDLLYMISWALRAMKSCQQIMHMIPTFFFMVTRIM